MANVHIRQVPDEVHRAIKARAKASGRSTEAEMRRILTDAVSGETPSVRSTLKAGDLLWDIWDDAETDDLDFVRDHQMPQPLDAS